MQFKSPSPIVLTMLVAGIIVFSAFFLLITDKIPLSDLIKKNTMKETEKTGEPGGIQIETVQQEETTKDESTNENVYTDEEYNSTKKELDETLENRILLIVIENNFVLPYGLEEDYQKYKFFINLALSGILNVDRKELNNKSLAEIVDVYLEDYLANRFKEVAKDYGEIVVLTDETASYNNFKRTLLSLNAKEKRIDVLLHLHGDPNTIYFYEQHVQKYLIGRDEDFGQESLNLGYVYQTVCYGAENMEIWLNLGAEVASGAKGVNNFVVLAPEKFLELWTSGETYYSAVNESFNYEVSGWKTASKFLPGTILSVAEEDLENSKMIFLGNKDYSVKQE